MVGAAVVGAAVVGPPVVAGLVGGPVVGGGPDQKKTVLDCSPQAAVYSIGVGMQLRQALARCHTAVFLEAQPRPERDPVPDPGVRFRHRSLLCAIVRHPPLAQRQP